MTLKKTINRLKAAEKKPIKLMSMANLSSKVTGLENMVVYVSPKEGSHGPRVKIARQSQFFKNPKENFSFSISDKPEIKVGKMAFKDFSSTELTKIKKWIKLNKESLLQLWNDDTILLDEFLDSLKKV